MIFSMYSYTFLAVIKMAEFRLISRLKWKLKFLKKGRCVQSFRSVVS